MLPAVITLLVLTVAEDPTLLLGERLVPLVKAHEGDVAIALKHLQNGATWSHRGDQVMPTASLIKVAVMAEVYQRAHEGSLSLTDPVTLRQDDKVPGAGILTTHFSDGATFPVRDAVRLMIVYSDNTATNLVLDKIGLDATAQRMESWGFPNTKIHAKVFRPATSIFPERSKAFGLGSTTANEMIRIFGSLHAGTTVSQTASAEMLEHLKLCDDREKFPRFLPKGTVVAHKTGSVNAVRTDAGIIYTPSGPIALCVLTARNKDESWQADNSGNLLCAKVAREVFEWSNSTLGPPRP